MHEASVSIPLGDLQTRLIAGQVPDWSGYEYLQPTLNKLITHNLLFDFTLPTAYTGAGMEVTRGQVVVQGDAGQHEREHRQDTGNSDAGAGLPRRLLRRASTRASVSPACMARQPTSRADDDVATARDSL